MQHEVVVEGLEGEGATGKSFSPARRVRAYVEDRDRIVRVAGGTEERSATSVWLDPENDVPVGSMVTVWLGTSRERRARVMRSSYLSDRQLPAHVVVNLE